ncbi:glycosyltransferase [Ectothiorhodospiraceae bacterium 2226]|nr:glycosyltransferase [Ectothiorhodospiraceae bacterium 2226]
MKWGDKYPARYVNILHAMVRRHLRLPHRFVCFTDDAEGLDPGIEHRPLPPVRLPGGPERGWRKLGVFAKRLADLEGTALFLDLDVVLLDSMDALFELAPGEFHIIRDWQHRGRITGNSSVFRFEVGAHADVLAAFEHDAAGVRRRFRNEQAFLSQALHERGRLRYWPDEWCRSFKRHCVPQGPLAWVRAPRPPAEAKIIVFHGRPNPPEAARGQSGKPLRFWRAAPWIETHWRLDEA